MAVYLARSECRDGFWNVVTYDITDPDDWDELSATPTEQICAGDEEPIEIRIFELPADGEEPSEPGPCERASITTSFSWTSPRSYTTVSPDEECPDPTGFEIELVAGLADARKFFLEIAERYCLKVGHCPDGEDCLAAVGRMKPRVELDGSVARVIDGEKDCHMRFTITGDIECRCREETEPDEG